MVVIEAMAAGLPVVAVGAGGVAEAVSDGVTGLLAAPEAGALAAAIRRMLDDPVLRDRCAAAGRAAARGYAIGELVHRLVGLYGQVTRYTASVAAPD
jgi:glycosyltransferase involved in cell wall biosynthesis